MKTPDHCPCLSCRCLPMNLTAEDLASGVLRDRTKVGASLADVDPMNLDTSVRHKSCPTWECFLLAGCHLVKIRSLFSGEIRPSGRPRESHSVLERDGGVPASLSGGLWEIQDSTSTVSWSLAVNLCCPTVYLQVDYCIIYPEVQFRNYELYENMTIYRSGMAPIWGRP